MKLIVDIDESDYERIKDLVANDTRYTTATTVGTAYQVIANGMPYEETQGDLISRSYLKQMIPTPIEDEYKYVHQIIDNAPTVEVPENAVNCVLTMFGECSYNETGCHDCEIKVKIRRALRERPQGEWVTGFDKNNNIQTYCNRCGEKAQIGCVEFCGKCGAKMKGGAE